MPGTAPGSIHRKVDDSVRDNIVGDEEDSIVEN
jgi:hypothetical protein